MISFFVSVCECADDLSGHLKSWKTSDILSLTFTSVISSLLCYNALNVVLEKNH